MTIGSISNSNGYDEPTNSPTGVTTSEARDRLKDTIFSALESGENTLIDAPTSLGKSYQIATTPWRDYPEVTGGEPVVHIHQTTDARDDAVKKSKAEDGIEYTVLRDKEETCPVARGDYDDESTAPDGSRPSEWFRQRCNVDSIPFWKAHRRFSKEVGEMSCSVDGGCLSKTQWAKIGADEPTFDVIHVTAQFAKGNKLIEGANLIFDEQPSYELSDSKITQLTTALNNLLHSRSNGDLKRSTLIHALDCGDDEILTKVRQTLNEGVTDEWLFGFEDSHNQADAFGQALTQIEPACEGRRVGSYENISVVLNEKDDVNVVHERPQLAKARCVIGLDAFPVEHLWEAHTVPDLRTVQVLSPEERRQWRRQERALEVVQLDEADRSYTDGWKSDGAERKAETIIHWLRDKYGDDFTTCITSMALKTDIEKKMKNAGVSDPTVLYYGNLKSLNDLKGEPVGLLLGCIDPGDYPILDDLALCGLDAEPETAESDDGEGDRLIGRNFVGPDADSAQQSLAAVRGNNLAQGVGRYAREPGTDAPGATVYTWSAALPDSLTDEILKGTYTKVTETQEEIVEYVREADLPVTVTEVKDECDVSRPTAWDTLKRMVSQGIGTVSEGTGSYGADEYEYSGGELQSTVEFS